VTQVPRTSPDSPPSYDRRCKDITLSILRGDTIPAPVPPEVADQVLQRLVLTGALGYVDQIGLKSEDADLLAAYDAYRTRFKLDAMRSNHICLQRTAHVSEALTQAGLTHLIVKGPLRQMQTYGTAYTRPSKDTDVLVAPKDFQAAIEALKANGYRPGMEGRREKWYKDFQGQLHMVDDQVSGWSIDLHKHLTPPQAERVSDHSQWFSEIIFTPLGLRGQDKTQLPIPNMDYANLVSILNIVKSLHGRAAEQKTLAGWRRSTLAHVCDLYVHVKDMSDQDMNAFLRHSKQAGLLSSSLLALRVVQVIFDHPFSMLAAHRTLLAEISDEDLINITLSPDDVTRWPTPHHLLIDLCRGDILKMARHLSWYLVSILARRVLVPAPSLPVSSS